MIAISQEEGNGQEGIPEECFRLEKTEFNTSPSEAHVHLGCCLPKTLIPVRPLG